VTKTSTGMPEKGTQTPSPSPDLIPAKNDPRDQREVSHSWVVSMEGSPNQQRQVCQSQTVSAKGFTPTSCGRSGTKHGGITDSRIGNRVVANIEAIERVAGNRFEPLTY
jgi:hypothetical protein